MRQDQRDGRREGEGGIPDGLLVGVLAFLLGMTLMVWTATGLAGWFSRGAWPHAVTFAHTPLAMRHLIGQPHDVAGAWPDTPAAQLSGYGLFWGLFIGQLMVLLVLTVFVLGTVVRWRAGRARRRAEATAEVAPVVPRQAEEPRPTMAAWTAPSATDGERVGGWETIRAEGAAPTAPDATDGKRAGGWAKTRAAGPVILAPPESRHTTATQAVRDAEGPALIITSNPATWSETKDARAKLGPVLLYDPTHLCDTPARLHWSPSTGCEDKATAAARATALLAPVRPTAKVDQPMADVAETLLRSYLHAAAVEGKPFRHVHRWAQGTQVQDAVRALRTNPKAASGAAGELEAALTSHTERRDIAQELTARALSSLFTVNIRESCTANRTDSLALDSFVNEGGTLYVVGEPIEDPKANPGAMPLLTALASSVVERGRRMAERSSSGRLDPPLTLVLDDVAAVAPLPQLPDLLAMGADRGLPTLALLRSQEQARSRWPQYELPL
ncbi:MULTISPECIES: type IV secretory system conjugative DNA transfer family protein [unclassified Streptomyces]|uniref:type IV secretory system conjugative DNA transfer family protein n=1 Tax=unclassified Streptomyces TaxID=2593676 RepID=UPI002E7FE11E|nr:type IV secretory system conjugative DNA transfer family protein [Streptomyces sp. NBC_00589]WTI38107.1 type IV secretory system conjugative DNA transfer family protein [Streptomyces sp. NBC_00775]WUB28214.1 type IV secretory system conjugative DNA transfer family protein [Streptomyces sp. NBC_00589]